MHKYKNAIAATGMFFLIKYTPMGVYAVVWTTAVLLTILNFICHPLYETHVMNISWKTFYPTTIRCLISCAVLTGTFKLLSYVYMPKTWATFITTAMIYAFVGGILHIIIVANKAERQMIFNKIVRRL